MVLYVLGLDVGFYHMGLVGCEVSESFELIKVDYCKLVDITNFKCDKKVCELYHDRCIADYMSHVFVNYYEIFDKADYIVIERQPPMGLVAVQELLRFRFRSKSILISPNSMHAHNLMSDLNYEERKVRVIKITENLLNKFESFNNCKRQHDLSDALCILKYFLFKKNNKYIENKMKEDIKKKNHVFIKNINQFCYNGDYTGGDYTGGD